MAFSDPAQNITALALAPGETVVDLGAGSGFYTLPVAAAIGSQGKVFAVDLRPDMLERIRKTATERGAFNVEYLLADLEQKGSLGLIAEKADAAICANVLFQIEDKNAAAAEMATVLRPGGRLLFIDWSDSFGGLGPQAEHLIGEDQARRLFESAGLITQRTVFAGDHHYGLVFKKRGDEK